MDAHASDARDRARDGSTASAGASARPEKNEPGALSVMAMLLPTMLLLLLLGMSTAPCSPVRRPCTAQSHRDRQHA